MFEEFAVSFENFISVFSAFFVENFLDLSAGLLYFLIFKTAGGQMPGFLSFESPLQ